MGTSQDHAPEFVQLLREFLTAFSEFDALLERRTPDDLSFAAVRALVGDDDRSVLYRLKERSHGLFRSEGVHSTSAVRREALFDLAIGSLFHEAMTLREGLYQREVYAPRLASLKAQGDEDAVELFAEFERILDKGALRLNDVVAEIRVLLSQTRDQLRRILIERSADRVVTRFLLRKRDAVAATFPEGFDGLIEAMHGDLGIGLVEAARSLLESGYFIEASHTLREAERLGNVARAEVQGLMLYAEGMQAILDEDYSASLMTLEDWVDSGAAAEECEFARVASAAVSRLERMASLEETGDASSEQAKAKQVKQLQLRLETAAG